MNEPLSPAAQAIKHAIDEADSFWNEEVAAATLQAAAAQMIRTDDLTDTAEDITRGAERHHQAGWLCTIASELEAPMPECLPIIPGNCGVGQNADGSWHYERLHGATPQGAAPWANAPAPEGNAPAAITAADRLALAVCRAIGYPGPCHPSQICNGCRKQSAAVAHELAAILRERHGGSSQVADWLDGVGCHPSTVLVDADGVLPVEQGITGNGSGASLPLLSNQPRVWEPLPGAE
jgi:hypothetical protein